MKILNFLIALVLSGNALAQFELRIVEGDEGTNSFALCYSSGDDAWNTAVITVHKIEAGKYRTEMTFRATEPIDEEDIEKFEKYIQLVTFNFDFISSNGVRHRYEPKLSGYEINLGDRHVEFYFEESKLVEYFQKYEYLSFYSELISDKTRSFSLSNFTYCLKQL